MSRISDDYRNHSERKSVKRPCNIFLLLTLSDRYSISAYTTKIEVSVTMEVPK